MRRFCLLIAGLTLVGALADSASLLLASSNTLGAETVAAGAPWRLALMIALLGFGLYGRGRHGK